MVFGMNEWRDEWMNQWMDESMDERCKKKTLPKSERLKFFPQKYSDFFQFIYIYFFTSIPL